MRPHELVKRKLATDWLDKAEADLNVAKHLVAEGPSFPNAIAFHCQQAAEKYLKAYLVWNEIDFPKTHDLEDLLHLAEGKNSAMAGSLCDVIILTPYGVDLRYPGDMPEAGPDEAREAVRLAQKVRDAVWPLLGLAGQ